MYGWLLYFLVVLVASLAVGRHLGRFRESCTEMTGMMAGMTIGMLGGFALGYGMTAAAGRDLFVGNLTGVLLGAALGGWFGRTGGLMGIMDGSMGGVMGGSMGAMIAAMVFPDWALNWTGVLFGGIYVVGSAALVALIESRSPEHEAMHWLLPKLAMVRREPRRVQATGKTRNATRTGQAVGASAASAGSAHIATARVSTASKAPAAATPAAATAPMQDYYALFGVSKDAGVDRIEEAYLDLLASADTDTIRRADRVLATLSDPERRSLYDSALAESLKRQPKPVAAEGRGDCCPPPKKKAASGPVPAENATGAVTSANPTAVAPSVNPATKATSAAQVAPATAALQATVSGRAPGLSTSRISAPAHAPSPASGAKTGEKVTARLAGSGAGQVTQATRGNQRTQGSKQKQTQMAQQPAVGGRSGKRSGQPTPSQERHGNRSNRNNRDGRYERSRKGGRQEAYQEPDLSFGRRIAIGMTATLAAVVILLLVVYISTVNSGSSAQASGYLNQSPAGAVYHVPGAVPSEAQLEGQAVAATVGADGVQTADLVLDQATSSYKPAAIKVKKGAPVRLNVTVEGSSRDCRSVVRIPALGAQALTQPGQSVPMNFTPSQAGVYEFNCPMQMMNPSYLVVTN